MTGTMLSRRSLIVGSLTLSALALTGCSGDEGEPAPSPSPTPRFDKPATLPKFPIAKSPAWGSKEAGLRSINDIIFFGDVAVIAGSTNQDQNGKRMIKVVDAQTGKNRWSKQQLKPLATSRPEVIFKPDIAVADDGRDGVVLVHYFSSECTTGMCAPGTVKHTDEQGIAALSLADGSVRWTHPVIPAVKSGTAKAEKLQDISMQLVSGLTTGLVIKGPTDGVIGGKYVDPDAMRTIALDPKTGKPSWSVKRAVAQRVVDDLVLATESTKAPARENEKMGWPLALDLRTGKEVWNRSKDFEGSILATTSGGLVIVQTVKEGLIDGQHLLKLTDGSTQLSLSADTPIMVGDKGGALFASYSSDLVTLAPDEKAPIRAARKPKGVFQVAAVHDGYLLTTVSAEPNKRFTVACDRSGNELSARIPGVVMKVNDTAMVTRSKSSSDAYGYDLFDVYPLES